MHRDFNYNHRRKGNKSALQKTLNENSNNLQCVLDTVVQIRIRIILPDPNAIFSPWKHIRILRISEEYLKVHPHLTRYAHTCEVQHTFGV